MKVYFLASIFSATIVAGCGSKSVSTEAEACELAKSSHSQQSGFPISRIASCDHVVEVAGPAGYFVLALHSDRECEEACSTNLGWFAVRKSDGELFVWDVAEAKLGARVETR